MAEFSGGEIVDVAIKGVRIKPHETGETGHVRILDERGITYPLPPQAAITRVAPADWPPRLSDLWQDSDERLYFVIDVRDHGDPDRPDMPHLRLISQWGETLDPDLTMAMRGLTLVRRDRAGCSCTPDPDTGELYDECGSRCPHGSDEEEQGAEALATKFALGTRVRVPSPGWDLEGVVARYPESGEFLRTAEKGDQVRIKLGSGGSAWFCVNDVIAIEQCEGCLAPPGLPTTPAAGCPVHGYDEILAGGEQR